MLDTRQDLPLGGAIALELIRDDDSRDVPTAFEQFPEEFLSGSFIPPTLHEDIEDMAILIHRPPQIVPFAVDRQKHLVQMPLITALGTPASQLIGIRLPELPTPLANGFIRDEHPTGEQELFDITITEAEPEI
jgi:hypothetical protein